MKKGFHIRIFVLKGDQKRAQYAIHRIESAGCLLQDTSSYFCTPFSCLFQSNVALLCKVFHKVQYENDSVVPVKWLPNAFLKD